MNTLNATTTVDSTHDFKSVYNLLRITYGVIPIVAGIDKFTNLLTNWNKYLNPDLASLLPFSPHTFMLIVGMIEVVAGVIVLVKPKIGAYIVMGWLTIIAITLLAGGKYVDVAVRDLVMAIGAFSLALIAKNYVKEPE